MLLMLDTLAFPTMFLAAMKAGIVPVPINMLLTSNDYAFMLADSRARTVIVDDVLLPKLAGVVRDDVKVIRTSELA